MRQDPQPFSSSNTARVKEPKYVVQLLFDVSSPSFTSHAGITGIAGDVIESTLVKISGVSQQIRPDEGRSTIGGLSVEITDLTDVISATDELKDQLRTNGQGIRGAEVRVFVGYSDDFAEFVRVATQVVRDVSLSPNGTYTIQTADISRDVRVSVFEPKQTVITAAIQAADTTINVDDASEFETVWHPSSFTDAPNQSVGYIKIEATGEIIRYTGKTATSFTGCTRGVLGTGAKAVDFDATAPPERAAKIREYIYLEMPAPMLMLAIMTGEIYGTSPTETLPAHWHSGISASWVDVAQYETIGPDLWDTNDPSKGFIVRFTGLKKTSARTFLERECHTLLGTFAPIGADGRIGLRRVNKILNDAAYIALLGEGNIISHGSLVHDQTKLRNQFRIDWNYDDSNNEFTRSTLFTDSTSISQHGSTEIDTWSFRGLHGSRHTAAIIAERIDTLRDRYSSPPLILDVQVAPAFNFLEVGDVVFVNLPNVADYTSLDSPPRLARSFEVQRANIDWQTGSVGLQLFASSVEKTVLPPPQGAGNVLSDGWYTSEGTEISTVLTVSAGSVTANGTLTGTADANAAGSIFYFDGDLTIDSGITVTIENNVTLRIKGTLTVNGSINGVANGNPGVADPDAEGVTSTAPHFGTSGFIGNTKGASGLKSLGSLREFNFEAGFTSCLYTAWPNLNLVIESPEALSGIPGDLRGTSGGPGGPIMQAIAKANGELLKAGGTGGASGAGLVIVSRGVAFGVSGEIDLSGGQGALGATVDYFLKQYRSGSGAAGGPGSCLVLLDGGAVPFPDFGGKFVALYGDCPIDGSEGKLDFALADYGTVIKYGSNETEPFIGHNSTIPFPPIENFDIGQSVLNIQYLPGSDQPTEDQGVSAPGGVTVTGVFEAVLIAWSRGNQLDSVQVYANTVNDRTTASLVFQGQSDSFEYNVDSAETYYFWLRAVDQFGRFSAWVNGGASPETATNLSGTAANVPVPAPSNLSVSGQVESVLLRWDLPTGNRSHWSQIEIWASEDNQWANAAIVGEVNGDSFVHPLDVGNSRYYWIRAVNKLGQTSNRVPDSDTSTFFATAQSGGGSLFIDPGFNLYPNFSDYWEIQVDGGVPADFAITTNGTNGDGAFEIYPDGTGQSVAEIIRPRPQLISGSVDVIVKIKFKATGIVGGGANTLQFGASLGREKDGALFPPPPPQSPDFVASLNINDYDDGNWYELYFLENMFSVNSVGTIFIWLRPIITVGSAVTAGTITIDTFDLVYAQAGEFAGPTKAGLVRRFESAQNGAILDDGGWSATLRGTANSLKVVGDGSGDANISKVELFDNSSPETLQAHIGFVDATNNAYLENLINGGEFRIRVKNNAGTAANMLTVDGANQEIIGANAAGVTLFATSDTAATGPRYLSTLVASDVNSTLREVGFVSPKTQTITSALSLDETHFAAGMLRHTEGTARVITLEEDADIPNDAMIAIVQTGSAPGNLDIVAGTGVTLYFEDSASNVQTAFTSASGTNPVLLESARCVIWKDDTLDTVYHMWGSGIVVQ